MIEQYQPTTTAGNVTPYMPQGLTGYVPTTVTPAPITSVPLNAPPTLKIQGGGGMPGFTFDFAKEQAKAYNKLKPFYDRLLEFAGGDLNLAKRILEYSYQQGTRESQQEYEQQVAEHELTTPVETEQLQTGQHRRGVLTSGFGKTERGRLEKGQNLRREAIERALKNRESRLSAERGFGLEEGQKGFEKERFDLERERRQEARGMAQDVFGIRQTQYQADLAKAQREEARRISGISSGALSSLYGGGGGGGGTFEQIMARTGQQSTVDAARKSGTYDQLKRSYGY